ncbi:MAG: hypothetical protein IT427_17595 [Pirellulales bacterium]|nr:hypothetical protein [Pirellulales bacterium]
MGSQLHVEIEPLQQQGDTLIIAAKVSGHPRRRSRTGKVWIEVPAALQSWLAIQGQADDIHDAFTRIFLLSAMEGHCDLVIHGNVSTRLLANLERWQAIASTWWPVYRRVELLADREISPAADAVQFDSMRAETLLALSGGLDSIETLYGHRLGRRGRNTRNITGCLFIHGCDIDWRDQRFAVARERVERLCQAADVQLVTARTNMKQLLPNWSISHCAAITGVMSLFQRRFAAGLIGCTWAYDNFEFVTVGNGSTAMTDPLLSSAGFQVIQDLAKTRIEKTLALRFETEVWKSLRVCYQQEDPVSNCGKCEKCIRQMLCMLAAGVDDFSSFRSPLTAEKIAATEPSGAANECEWRACYAVAQQQGLENRPEFRAMGRVLDRYALKKREVPVHLLSVAEQRRRKRGRWLQRMLRMI